MARHDKAKDGLWATSSSPESWHCLDFFDTREEAVEHGNAEFDGDGFYVGQVQTLTDDEIVDGFLRDQDDADEQIRIQDEWCWCEDPVIAPVPDAAWQELRDYTREWVRRHKLNSGTWMIEGEEVEATNGN